MEYKKRNNLRNYPSQTAHTTAIGGPHREIYSNSWSMPHLNFNNNDNKRTALLSSNTLKIHDNRTKQRVLQNTHHFKKVALLRQVCRVKAAVVRLPPQDSFPGLHRRTVVLYTRSDHLELGKSLPLRPRASSAFDAHLELRVPPEKR